MSSLKTARSWGTRTQRWGLVRVSRVVVLLALLAACSGTAPQVAVEAPVEPEFRPTENPVVFEFDVLKHVDYSGISLPDLVSESGKAALQCESERGDSGVDGPGHRCELRDVTPLELGPDLLLVASVERDWRADKATWGHTTDILVGKPVALTEAQECCRVELVGRYPAAQVNSWRSTTNLTLHRDAVATYQDETVLCIEEVVEEGPGSAWLDATSALDAAWSPGVRGHRVAAFRFSARSGLMERAAAADRECPQRGYGYLLPPSLDEDRLDVRTALGAAGEVQQVATGSNGWVAEATEGVITVWTGERKAAYQLRGHRAPITALTFSADAETLYSADLSGRVVVWELRTGDRSVLSAERPIYDLALAPDEKHVALALRGAPTVALMRLLGGTLTPLDSEDAAWSVAFAPDGALAVGGEGWLGVWDVDPGDAVSQRGHLRAEPRVAEHASSVLDVAFDGTKLYVADAKGALSRWTATPLALEVTMDHPAPAPLRPERLSVVSSADGVFSSAADGQVFLWRGERESALAFEAAPRSGVAVADGVLQASGPNGGVIRWSERLQSELAPLNRVPVVEFDEPESVALLDVGDLLAPDPEAPLEADVVEAFLSIVEVAGGFMTAHGGVLYVLDQDSVRVVNTTGAAAKPMASDESIRLLAVSRGGGKLFGASDEFVRTWPLPGGKTLPDKMHALGDPRQLASSADGSVVALLGGSSVEVWRTVDEKAADDVYETVGASAIALSGDGAWLAIRVGSELWLRNFATDEVQRRTLLSSEGGLAFSEAGQLVCLNVLEGGEWAAQTWMLSATGDAWVDESHQFGALEGATTLVLSTNADHVWAVQGETLSRFDL